jgi:hypothetical protein
VAEHDWQWLLRVILKTTDLSRVDAAHRCVAALEPQVCASLQTCVLTAAPAHSNWELLLCAGCSVMHCIMAGCTNKQAIQ